MIKDLTATQNLLANLMSEISERCYSAAWMADLEYVLWDAVTSGPRKYGHGSISEGDITALKKCSNEANCWIYFDDTTEETALRILDWTDKFNAVVAVNPDVLHRV